MDKTYTFYDAAGNKWNWREGSTYADFNGPALSGYTKVPEKTLESLLDAVNESGYMTLKDGQEALQIFKNPLVHLTDEEVVQGEARRYPIKMDDKGNLVIDLLDVISELPDERKIELLSEHGWMSFISSAMAESLIDRWAGTDCNSLVHRLRTSLITSENMPKILRRWAETMISEQEYAIKKDQYWSHCYYDLKSWVQKRFDRIEVPKLPEQEYGRSFDKEILEAAYAQLEAMKLEFPESKEDEVK